MMMKQWAKREMQIERGVGSTAGLYGDLQGIVGRTLQQVDGLGVELLAGPSFERPALYLDSFACRLEAHESVHFYEGHTQLSMDLRTPGLGRHFKLCQQNAGYKSQPHLICLQT
jgi:hypothetical protein